MKLSVFAVLLADKSLDEACKYLADSGVQAVEIGCGQGAEVCALFRGQGYEEVTCLQDLGGLDRVVLGRRPK